jgi:hypothetical protein
MHTPDSLGFKYRGHLESLLHENSSLTINTSESANTETPAEASNHKSNDQLKLCRTFLASELGDDPIEAETPTFDIVHDTVDELEVARQKLVEKARANEMSASGLALLCSLLDSYKDVFRLKLSAAPAARFPPLKVELKANVVPVRQRLRRYPPRQAAFLAHYCAELERQGYVRKTHRAQWIAAPHIVPKPSPSQFHLTVDSRPINRANVPIIFPMPHLESALASLRGASCFAKVDLSAGYYQIAVHESYQDLFAFITPQGVYAPKRLLQGSRNAAAYFQMCIHNALVDANLYSDVIQWLDDILFHAGSEDALLKVLESFFLCAVASGFSYMLESVTFSRALPHFVAAAFPPLVSSSTHFD